MNRLIDLLNESTPIEPPFGRLIVIAGVFVLAWLLSRLAGRLAAFLVDRSERRTALGADHVDTGVISGLKQRETAISLIQTSVTYLVFGIALLLAVMTLTGARRVEAVVGASFLAIAVAFSFQRFLTDVIAGLLMRVSNSEVKAVRVLPRGYRNFEAELYVSDLERAQDLVERVARIVPSGPTHFVRRPAIDETEDLDDDLHRIRVRAAVAAGRDWLAQDFLPSLICERADDGLVVHGPVVTAVDEQTTRRFARAAWTGGPRRSSYERAAASSK